MTIGALKLRDRLELLTGAKRPQRRGVAIDHLFRDLAVPKPELVDAAPGETRAIYIARSLPFDNHHIAARGPVEQLPDEIRRGRSLHFQELWQLISLQRPLDQRRMQG